MKSTKYRAGMFLAIDTTDGHAAPGGKQVVMVNTDNITYFDTIQTDTDGQALAEPLLLSSLAIEPEALGTALEFARRFGEHGIELLRRIAAFRYSKRARRPPLDALQEMRVFYILVNDVDAVHNPEKLEQIDAEKIEKVFNYVCNTETLSILKRHQAVRAFCHNLN